MALAIAGNFAANGAQVHVFVINLGAAESAAEQILKEGGRARTGRCDVTRQEEVQAVFDKIFALERIHILINNAGIAHVGNLEKTTEMEFDRVFQVNVRGYYNC